MRNLLMLLTFCVSQVSFAADEDVSYGTQLCHDNPEYSCITVKDGETWDSLWSDPDARDLVKRVNRTNNKLKTNMVLAVPDDVENKTIWDLAPFQRHVDTAGRKLIIVDQTKLAWGSYDSSGELQWWGPISSGKDQCSDSQKKCRTVTGKYYVFDKKETECESNVFPIGRGGAKMPYCMYFYRGFALHGSDNVPGYRDSHGCVRLFTEDAKWLNEKFVELPNKDNNYQGTEVIIKEIVNN